MPETTELELVAPAPPAERPRTMLDLIAQVSLDPRMDPDRLERLMNLQERYENRQAEIAFTRDMVSIQGDIPEILKDSKGHNFMYAKLEDIDRRVQPLLSKYGFCVSYDSQVTEKGSVIWKCIVAHREGHKEIFSTPPLPPDETGSKNKVQAVFSAGSYGQRYSFCAAFKIVPRGMDDAGAAFSFLNDEQINKISDMLNACDIKAGTQSWQQFLYLADADEIAHIQQRSFERLMAALRQRLAKQREGK